MRTVQIAGSGFGPIAASHATSFYERLMGLGAGAAPPAMLIDAPSIHTFGMAEPIGVVGLDARHRVVAARIVPPNRVVWLKGSSQILEVPQATGLPVVGARLRLDADE